MKRDNTIVFLSKKYDTDKKMDDGKKCHNGVYGHNYARHYDKYLKGMKVNNMLEIGVSWGASIKMWDEFFNKNTQIYGIDINEKRFKKKNLETSNIKIYLGNQNDVSFLKKLSNIPFDFIIDDGSHRMKDQQVSLKYLFTILKNGGLYVLEDLHTSKYSSFYDNKKETTTIDLLKALKKREKFFSHYMDDKEYQYLLDNIDSINILEDDHIAFIKKK